MIILFAYRQMFFVFNLKFLHPPSPFPAKEGGELNKRTSVKTLTKSIIFVFGCEIIKYRYGHHFNVLRDYHFDVLFG